MSERRICFHWSGGTFHRRKVVVKRSESGGVKGIGMLAKTRPWVVGMGIWSVGESRRIVGSKGVVGMLSLKLSTSIDKNPSRQMRLGSEMRIWKMSVRQVLALIDDADACCSCGGYGDGCDGEWIRLRIDGRPKSWIGSARHCEGA